MSTIRQIIAVVVHDQGEVHGAEELLRILREEFGTGHNRTWTFEQIAALEENGYINVVRAEGGGRGRKNIIRKNRSYPRRTS